MVKLIIEDDEGKTTVVPLIRDEISIGRKEGNTIRLTERNVSRRHAKLLKQNGALFIEDLNSYNGIKVNGNKIAGRVAVAEGDRIRIGDYILGLKMEGVADSAADSQAITKTEKLPAPSETAPVAAVATETELPPGDKTEEVREPTPVPRAARAGKAKAAASVSSKPTEITPEQSGRLVCISSNFAGQEWLLDRPIMVIGRTEDNDVVVNHRSISRHHARITEENGRYTIIDLQSSNGVRINGDEYGKVELRRGDRIDLGHVRLRFVAPGEDFDLSHEAIVDIEGRGGGRTALWVAMACVALIGVGLVVWRTAFHGGDGGDRGKQAVAKADATGSAAPQKDDKTHDPQHGNAGSTISPEVLLANVTRFLDVEQWDEALKACAQLQGEAKKNAETSCEKATLEKGAQSLFEEARAAAMQNEYLKAVRLHSKIPESSIFRKRDTPLFDTARTNFLAQARKTLDEHVKQGECEQAKTVASEIKELDAVDTSAAPLADSCKKGGGHVTTVAPKNPGATQLKVVRVRTPRPHNPTPPTPKNPETSPDEPETTDPKMSSLDQAKQLLEKARQFYVAGNHVRAIKLSQQVLTLTPGNVSAIQILGSSACYTNNRRLAQWAYDRLSAAGRNLLRSVCMRNSLQLDE